MNNSLQFFVGSIRAAVTALKLPDGKGGNWVDPRSYGRWGQLDLPSRRGQREVSVREGGVMLLVRIYGPAAEGGDRNVIYSVHLLPLGEWPGVSYIVSGNVRPEAVAERALVALKAYRRHLRRHRKTVGGGKPFVLRGGRLEVAATVAGWGWGWVSLRHLAKAIGLDNPVLALRRWGWLSKDGDVLAVMANVGDGYTFANIGWRTLVDEEMYTSFDERWGHIRGNVYVPAGWAKDVLRAVSVGGHHAEGWHSDHLDTVEEEESGQWRKSANGSCWVCDMEGEVIDPKCSSGAVCLDCFAPLSIGEQLEVEERALPSLCAGCYNAQHTTN